MAGPQLIRSAARHWKWLASFRRDTSGASAAEFALVVPVFILLTFGTVSAGILLSAITQMHFAAEKAARCLSVDVAGNCPTGAIDAYAKTFYNGPAVTGLTFTRTSPAPSCGNQITASGTYQFITGFSSTSVNLSSSACYPLI